MIYYLPAGLLAVVLVALPIWQGSLPDWELAPLCWFLALAGAAFGISRKPYMASLHVVAVITFTVLLWVLRLLGES